MICTLKMRVLSPVTPFVYMYIYTYINFIFFINHFLNVPVHSNIKNVQRTDYGKLL